MTAYGLIAAKENGTCHSLGAKGSENNCLFGQVSGRHVDKVITLHRSLFQSVSQDCKLHFHTQEYSAESLSYEVFLIYKYIVVNY